MKIHTVSICAANKHTYRQMLLKLIPHWPQVQVPIFIDQAPTFFRHRGELPPHFKISRFNTVFKLDRDIDHHTSYVPFEIGVILSVHLSICLSVHIFCFQTLDSKTVCPIEFKLDRDIDHHHS